jgi:hypothetical protein
MTINEEQLTRLNAYVDGELTPSERSDIAHEIAVNPAAAHAVAALSAVKVGVKEAFATDHLQFDPNSMDRSSGPFVKIATSVACLMMVCAAVWLFAVEIGSKHDGFAEALKKYDNMQTSEPAKPLVVAAFGGLIVPDLSPAGLTIAWVETGVQIGLHSALHVTYLGKRGCRLSLFVYDAPGGKLINTSAKRKPDILAEHWSTANIGYLLLARRMNSDRFNVLAGAIQEATIKAAPLMDETRLAMRSARQPCTA